MVTVNAYDGSEVQHLMSMLVTEDSTLYEGSNLPLDEGTYRTRLRIYRV